MADSPDPIARQRKMVHSFRSAHRTRSTAEAAVTARRQSLQQSADAVLAETTQAAQLRRDQAVRTAAASVKTARDMAITTRDLLVATAGNQRTQARSERDQADDFLSTPALRHLLTAAKTQPPNPTGDSAVVLQIVANDAAVYKLRVKDGVRTILDQRDAVAARRRTMGIVMAIAGVMMIILGWIGIDNVQQNRAAARAVATATAKAAFAQATATAVTQAALTALPAEFRPLYEQFGLSFVQVPAGEFTMGSNDGDDDEQPVHRLSLDELWIGLTEVTNVQYRPFVEAGGYTDDSLWTDAGWQWRTDSGFTQPGCWDDTHLNADEQPVVCVSWYEAMAYAAWLSRETGMNVRLPTEAEWEKAARGSDVRTYPWGEEEPDETFANFGDSGGQPSAVGSYPAGASATGALDMAGNVWEWTSSRYAGYPYVADDGREDASSADPRVVRGGSWYYVASLLRAAARDRVGPGYRDNNQGFRLAVAPQ